MSTRENNPRIVTSLLAGGLAAVLIAAGCKVGPDYSQPKQQMPDEWASHADVPSTAATTQPSDMATSQPAAQPKPVDLTRWWTSFNDPILNSLIERAIENNLDLRLAVARIREARANRGIVEARLFPQVVLNGGYDYNHISANTPQGSGYPVEGTTNKPGFALSPPTFSTANQRLLGAPSLLYTPRRPALPTTTLTPGRPPTVSGAWPNYPTGSGLHTVAGQDSQLYTAGFDASWEIDVFGGIRRSVEAADQDIRAAVEARNDVLVTVMAEVARNYVELRGAQRRAQIATINIAIQRGTVALVNTRFNAGLANELVVAQAKAQLSFTESTLPVIIAQEQQAKYALGVLLGMQPEALVAELSEVKPIPLTPRMVPTGLPSSLLRRRPDIRQNERLLAAATARIGVATADLFPKFSITGSYGLQSTEINHFLDQKSMIWSVGPSVSWPIFDAGKIIANIARQGAIQEQTLVTYQKTVLLAMQEVESNLVGYSEQRQSYEKVAESARESKQAADLAVDRYQKGLVDFLNVLDAQRTLFQVEDRMVQSETQTVLSLVALYKALGGGWDPDANPSLPIATMPPLYMKVSPDFLTLFPAAAMFDYLKTPPMPNGTEQMPATSETGK